MTAAPQIGKNFLIVEDEPMIAMLFEDFLEMLGHKMVHHAETLDDALIACDKGGFDAAILDVHLGHNLVWPVAQRLQSAAIPIIIASGGTEAAMPVAIQRAAILQKPFNIRSLEQALSQIL